LIRNLSTFVDIKIAPIPTDLQVQYILVCPHKSLNFVIHNIITRTVLSASRTTVRRTVLKLYMTPSKNCSWIPIYRAPLKVESSLSCDIARAHLYGISAWAKQRPLAVWNCVPCTVAIASEKPWAMKGRRSKTLVTYSVQSGAVGAATARRFDKGTSKGEWNDRKPGMEILGCSRE